MVPDWARGKDARGVARYNKANQSKHFSYTQKRVYPIAMVNVTVSFVAGHLTYCCRFFRAIQLAPQALDRKSAAKSDDFRPDDLDNMDPEAAWKKNKDCSTASATK